MVFRLSHFGICVTDLRRSIDFYTALGFTKAEGFELPCGIDTPIDTLLEMRGAHLVGQFMRRTDGTAIELLSFESPPAIGPNRRAMNELGYTHMSFHVDDLEAAMAAVEAAGGTVHRHTRTYFDDAGMHAVFCSDPDGVRIELMQLVSAR